MEGAHTAFSSGTFAEKHHMTRRGFSNVVLWDPTARTGISDTSQQVARVHAALRS